MNTAWYNHGRIAQLVERLVYTQVVGGSSPSSPTIDSIKATHSLGAAVARPDYIGKITGSNPVARVSQNGRLAQR